MIAALALAGCAGQTIDDQTKGAESPLPEDQKDDSFRKPTEHGPLSFGSAAEGELTEEEHYHAWFFELSVPASVVLRTNPVTANLDTVMYLYRRSPGDTLWGAYRVRNDDHDGQLWSRIERDLDAGEYRVLVKAFKTSIRGHFELHGECSGAGCPSSAVEATLPSETGLTQPCARDVEARLGSPLLTTDGGTLRYDTERQLLDGTTRRAVELYRSYWEEIGVWEDFGADGPVELGTETIVLEDATLVSVDLLFGDETTVWFVFGEADTLLLLYHSEQSPTVQWFCDTSDAEPVAQPDERCVGAWLRHLPHDADQATERSGEVKLGAAADAVDVSAAARLALADYLIRAEALPSDSVGWTAAEWDATDLGRGAKVTIGGPELPTLAYSVGLDDFGGGTWLFVVTSETSTGFICSQSF